MKRLFLLVLGLSILTFVQAQLSVGNLRTENLANPMGLETLKPRLSWQLSSPQRNVLQTAYEIRVAGTVSDLAKGKNILWQSGKINTDASVHVEYGGPAPKSGQLLYWQVRVWDNQGRASAWSSPAGVVSSVM